MHKLNHHASSLKLSAWWMPLFLNISGRKKSWTSSFLLIIQPLYCFIPASHSTPSKGTPTWRWWLFTFPYRQDWECSLGIPKSLQTQWTNIFFHVCSRLGEWSTARDWGTVLDLTQGPWLLAGICQYYLSCTNIRTTQRDELLIWISWAPTFHNPTHPKLVVGVKSSEEIYNLP